MSSIPRVVGTAAPAPSTRARVLALLVTMTVALAVLVTPQFTENASARSLPKNAYVDADVFSLTSVSK